MRWDVTGNPPVMDRNVRENAVREIKVLLVAVTPTTGETTALTSEPVTFTEVLKGEKPLV